MVCTCNNDNLNSLMPSLGNRSNNSVLLGFVEAVKGRNGRVREVID